MKKPGWYDRKCPRPRTLPEQTANVRRAWNDLVLFMRQSSVWVFRVIGKLLPVADQT